MIDEIMHTAECVATAPPAITGNGVLRVYLEGVPRVFRGGRFEGTVWFQNETMHPMALFVDAEEAAVARLYEGVQTPVANHRLEPAIDGSHLLVVAPDVADPPQGRYLRFVLPPGERRGFTVQWTPPQYGASYELIGIPRLPPRLVRAYEVLVQPYAVAVDDAP